MSRTAPAAKIDRSLLQKMRPEIEEALEVLGQKFGVHLATGNARFTDMNCTMKLEISVLGDDGEAISPEIENWRAIAPHHGFKADDAGVAKFKIRGEEHVVTGWHPRRRKYPITGKRLRDGKRFKFDVWTVKNAMGLI